jgi:5-methylcytosine-specific restriction endonuclease McrA
MKLNIDIPYMGSKEAQRSPARGRPAVIDRRQRKLEHERQLRQARQFVRKRDGGTCKCCGKAGAEVHHLQYRSQGGDHDPNNLALLCKRCHEDIHAHLIKVTFGGRNLARTVKFVRLKTTK